MKPLFYMTILSLFFFFACGEKKTTAPKAEEFLNFSDAVIQEIYKLQDRRDAKGLIAFLKSENPMERYLAATAFASIQDSSTQTISALAQTLQNINEDENIRAIAAYALGQTKSNAATQVLINAFQNQTSKSWYLVNAQILEAVGRCAAPSFLKYISTTTNYLPSDTLMLEGQAWAIYRYMQRGITANEGSNRMLKLLENPTYPPTVRRIAASYFSRLPVAVFDHPAKVTQLIQLAQNEKDDFTRMALASGLGKFKQSSEILVALQDMFRAENNPLVKINILKSLSRYQYVDVKPIYLGALRDANPQVVRLASEYFMVNGIRNDVDLYYGIGIDSTSSDEVLKINMLGAALAQLNSSQYKKREIINNVLKAKYNTAKTPYLQAQALEALATFVWNYQFIYDKSFENKEKVVKSTGIRALGKIRRNPKLAYLMGGNYPVALEFFKKAFTDAVLSGDAGMMAEAATILQDPILGYDKVFIAEVPLLREALQKLTLPRDVEIYHEIQKTISFIAKDSLSLAPTNAKYAIDWAILKGLKNKTKATIKTNKGDVVLQLFPVEAPSAVSNFVKLAKKGFYKNKAFHRVVPNFVAQVGCPRGDGWGSTDNLVRSEFSPLKYDDAGWVGLASAGKDTESCQFFITHSPAPHLDGRYTIFAKVIQGMDIVQTLAIGDVVKDIKIE